MAFGRIIKPPAALPSCQSLLSHGVRLGTAPFPSVLRRAHPLSLPTLDRASAVRNPGRLPSGWGAAIAARQIAIPASALWTRFAGRALPLACATPTIQVADDGQIIESAVDATARPAPAAVAPARATPKDSALATARGLTDAQLSVVHGLLDTHESLVSTWPPAKQRWIYDLFCVFASHLFPATSAQLREWPTGHERVVNGAGQYYDDTLNAATGSAVGLDGIVRQIAHRPLMAWRQLVARTFTTLRANEVVERAGLVPGTVMLPLADILAATGRAEEPRLAGSTASSFPQWEAALREVTPIAEAEADELRPWIAAQLRDVVALPADLDTRPPMECVRACGVAWLLRLQALHLLCATWGAPWNGATLAERTDGAALFSAVGAHLREQQQRLSASQGELSSQEIEQLAVLQTALDLFEHAPSLATVAQWFAGAVAPLHAESVPLSFSVFLGLAIVGDMGQWSMWVERLDADPVLSAYRLVSDFLHEQAAATMAESPPDGAGTLAAELAGLVQDPARARQCRAVLAAFATATDVQLATGAGTLLSMIPDPDLVAVSVTTPVAQDAHVPTWVQRAHGAVEHMGASHQSCAAQWIIQHLSAVCDLETALADIQDPAERLRRSAIELVRRFATLHAVNVLLATCVEASFGQATPIWMEAARDELARSLATLPDPLRDAEGNIAVNVALQRATGMWPHAVDYAAMLAFDRFEIPVWVVNVVCVAFRFDPKHWSNWVEARRGEPLAVVGALIRLYQQLIDSPDTVDSETLAEANRLLAQWNSLRGTDAEHARNWLVANRLLADFEAAREAEGRDAVSVLTALRQFVDPSDSAA
ncbi:MAG: hypothetical protein HY696_03035 [Deltaproteobacteria bacterium]|nr:hypothetical protein [Deltaproteobacteria bacterium]